MKKLLVVVSAFVAVSAFADVVATTNAPRRKLDRKKMEANWYKRTGGLLAVPNAQQGKIVFVNAQKTAKTEWLSEVAKFFADDQKLDIRVEDGTFAFPDTKIVGDATLFVIDDPKLPSLLHAPENRWTMINVANLQEGRGAKPQFFEARVKKEVTRGFCLLAGTQTSNYPESLLTTVTKPADLDKFPDWGLPVDIPQRFIPYLEGLGIKPAKFTTYKKACMEGWAPAPTNDIQKAILEEVKHPEKRWDKDFGKQKK